MMVPLESGGVDGDVPEDDRLCLLMEVDK